MSKVVGFLMLSLVIVTGDASATTSAWAWANQPGAASYSPSVSYSNNPSGEPITITRPAKGTYTVTFSGLAELSGMTGNVQVTSSGWGTNVCRAVRWSFSGSDLVVTVRCMTTAGKAADNAFTVLYTFE